MMVDVCSVVWLGVSTKQCGSAICVDAVRFVVVEVLASGVGHSVVCPRV